MALVKCKECGAQVSDQAGKCPHCGAKVAKPTSRLTIGLVGLVSIFMVKCVYDQSTRPPPPPPPAKSADQVKADVDLNTAIAAARVLKQSMKDPSTFKVSTFLIFPGGDTCIEYSAKNSFNATQPGTAVYLATPPKLLVREREANATVKAWNRVCTKQGGHDHAGGLNVLGTF
jgi:hypothetical protein